MSIKGLFTPWSSLGNMLGKPPSWWPEEEQPRIQSYEKYDQLYWNDPTQYSIRVLDGEQPLYIPNARVIVNTTSYYLLKDLKVALPAGDPNTDFFDAFLKRERFYSKFHTNKRAGITRGDWVFHLVADDNKADGEKVSIETLHPGSVWMVPDEDNPDKIVRIHLVDIWIDPNDPEEKERLKKLTYEKVVVGGKNRISRVEEVFELQPAWYNTEPAPVKYKTLLNRELLPEDIDQFPVYWFPNIEWEGQLHGSSELRGLEFLDWAVSQAATDTEAALALEGLGVFATDGGRPVNDDGSEGDWEVAPGKVMEVPSGSYFRRVDGVGSITPMMEQIKYLEEKMLQASGTTDVAMGDVDVQVAQSGIALAIKFMPTMAKIQERDTLGVELTQQMFYDLRKWFKAYEGKTIAADFIVTIDHKKLPMDPKEALNELNNMFDRKIISRKTYREEMKKLGYDIDHQQEEDQLQAETEADAKRAAMMAPPPLADNAQAAAAGQKGFSTGDDFSGSTVDSDGNQSNNRNRPNESSGTEAD